MKYLILLFTTITLYSCSSESETKKINTQNLNFNDIFTFQVDTLDLDMVSDVSENSLYITYSANNGYNENVLKYNLSTLTSSALVHPDISESREIEIIGNYIYSISSNDVCKYDLNLNNLTNINNGHNNSPNNSAIEYNNNILIPRGTNNILTYQLSTNTYSYPTNIFGDISRMDGEIINNNLYTFGGTRYINGVNVNSNEIQIFNFGSNLWTTQTLPFQVYESFTDKYNNNIIVGGNKLTNSSNSFLGIYNPITNVYNSFTTSLNLNNITIRSITVLNDNLYIAYTDFVTPMPNLISIKVAKASLL